MTVITVTGNPNPDCRGTYTEAGYDYRGKPVYIRSDGAYVIFWGYYTGEFPPGYYWTIAPSFPSSVGWLTHVDGDTSVYGTGGYDVPPATLRWTGFGGYTGFPQTTLPITGVASVPSITFSVPVPQQVFTGISTVNVPSFTLTGVSPQQLVETVTQDRVPTLQLRTVKLDTNYIVSPVTMTIRTVGLEWTETPEPLVIRFDTPTLLGSRVTIVGPVTIFFVPKSLPFVYIPDPLILTFSLIQPDARTVVAYAALWAEIGEFVEAANAFSGFAVTIGTQETEILDQLALTSMFDMFGDITSTMETYKDEVVDQAEQMAVWAEDRFLDWQTMLDEIPLMTTSTGITELLLALYKVMVADGQTLNASTVTVGSIFTEMQEGADGALFISKVLDGYNEPTEGGTACPDYIQDLSNPIGSGRFPGEHADYEGTYSQLSFPSDKMYLVCTGQTEDSEMFDWIGELESRSPYDWKYGGAGEGPSVIVMNSGNKVSGGGFETFSSDVPSGWTLDAGAATENVSQETTIVKRGSGCLKLVGNGNIASIQLSQTVSGLTKGRRYVLGCWVRSTAGFGRGTLTIQMEGTGYTAGVNGVEKERIQLTAAELAGLTTWETRYFFFNTPMVIPSDFKVVIKLDGTPWGTVYVDGMALKEAVYHNGVCVGILNGGTRFQEGDRFKFTVTNDGAGLFQDFMRRNFGIQMPSDDSGGETISDALCTD